MKCPTAQFLYRSKLAKFAVLETLRATSKAKARAVRVRCTARSARVESAAQLSGASTLA